MAIYHDWKTWNLWRSPYQIRQIRFLATDCKHQKASKMILIVEIEYYKDWHK